MNHQHHDDDRSSLARRSFIKDSGLMIAGGAIGGAVAVGKAVKGNQDRPLRIAFVGCGRRAKTLADSVLGDPKRSDQASQVEVAGIADVVSSQTQAMYRSLKGRYRHQIADDCVRSFGKKCLDPILDSNVDAVYLATPPVDRPVDFERIVASGKHVFLEKPLAADVRGVIKCVEVAQKARLAGLTVHVGFQRRYDQRYRDVIAQIHQDAIGQPLFARAFCNAGPLRKVTPKPKESRQDFELRNWNHFQWTGGDFLLEQHVAGLDVIRWALDQVPVVAQGQGGWGTTDSMASADAGLVSASQYRSGEVFDHHSIEFEFGSGAILMSQCRRVAKAWNHTSEHIHGTKGRADLTSGIIYDLAGNVVWKSEFPSSLKSATASQQNAFVQSILNSEAQNEVESAADSTLFAMLGHRATQTGKRIRFEKLIKEA